MATAKRTSARKARSAGTFPKNRSAHWLNVLNEAVDQLGVVTATVAITARTASDAGEEHMALVLTENVHYKLMEIGATEPHRDRRPRR